MTEKLVSTVIPSYNRPTVDQAVESALNQSYENIEVIVVDDHSKTPVREHLEDIDDERLTVIRHEENKNGSAARNTGIEASKGDYIALLDDDDEWKEEKIEKQMEKIEETGQEVQAVFTWAQMSDGSVLKSDYTGDIRKNLLLGKAKGSYGSSLLISKDIVEKIDGFDEDFERHQDWEFLLRALEHTEIEAVKEPLIYRDMDYGYPSPEKTLGAKKLYLEKFEELIQSYSFTVTRRIYAFHYRHLADVHSFHDQKIKGMKFYLRSVTYWPFQNTKKLARTPYYLIKNIFKF